MDLLGIVGDERDPRPGFREPARRVEKLAEHGCAHDQHGVEGRQPFAQLRPVARKHARIQGVVLRKAGTGSERLLEDRRDEPLRQFDQGRPGRRIVRARTDDERRRLRLREKRCQGADRRLVDGRRAHDLPDGGRGLPVLVLGSLPVVPRDDHERGTACRLRRVKRMLERARDVLGPNGLIDEDGIVAGETGEPPREKRLEREVPAVLLADHDDDRRAVDPRGRERPDRVPEPGRRVQHGQRGLPAPDRPARRETDHRPLVERQHEAEVVRQPGEEGNLRRAGVREHRRQATPAEDVEGGVANGSAHAKGSWSVQNGERVRGAIGPCISAGRGPTIAPSRRASRWDSTAVENELVVVGEFSCLCEQIAIDLRPACATVVSTRFSWVVAC